VVLTFSRVLGPENLTVYKVDYIATDEKPEVPRMLEMIGRRGRIWALPNKGI
jgi:hypothetical protein